METLSSRRTMMNKAACGQEQNTNNIKRLFLSFFFFSIIDSQSIARHLATVNG